MFDGIYHCLQYPILYLSHVFPCVVWCCIAEPSKKNCSCYKTDNMLAKPKTRACLGRANGSSQWHTWSILGSQDTLNSSRHHPPGGTGRQRDTRSLTNQFLLGKRHEIAIDCPLGVLGHYSIWFRLDHFKGDSETTFPANISIKHIHQTYPTQQSLKTAATHAASSHADSALLISLRPMVEGSGT